MVLVNITEDFSAVPAGRFRSDGPFSGEAFREEFLIPALKLEDDVRVSLDGGEGHGSSFLEEAFGGLVRRQEFEIKYLRSHLKLLSEDETLIDEIWEYIERAKIGSGV